MFRVLLVFLFGSCVVGAELHKFSDAYIDEINGVAETWTAGRNFPANLTDSYLRSFLIGDEKHVDQFEWPSAVDRKLDDPEYGDSIPDRFDAREQWRDCPRIREVPDTGACAAPQIFAAVAAFEDRRCIRSRGDAHESLSTEYVAACCRRCRYDESVACSHGSLFRTWAFLHWRGTVTGGRYGERTGCQPSTIRRCSHYGSNPQLPHCEGQSLPKLQCHTRCLNENYPRDFFADKHKATPAYWVDDKEETIQKEILAHGPTTAAFILYDDFYHYKSGVYKHTPNAKSEKFVQSAKLIGWGTEAGVPYWLLINTWGPEWGDRGTFKILRGKFECGIEYLVAAGKAKD